MIYVRRVTQKWWFSALGPCLTAIAMFSFTLGHRAGSGVWWFTLVLGVLSAVLGVGSVVVHVRGDDDQPAHLAE